MKFVIVLISLLSMRVWSQTVLSVPVKFLNAELTQPAPSESRFLWNHILFNHYIAIKHAEWKTCHRQNGIHFESGQQESLKYFLETNKYISSLAEMDTKQLIQGTAAIDPWSGDYWAYARGLLGYRFLDQKFLENFDWRARYDYIQKNSAQLRIEMDGQTGVNSLSPSEKYDLIVGDDQFSLTDAMWEQGKFYYDETGKVEEWMGICHGWASASIILPRPKKSVQIFSPEQKWPVSLNPSEIKGLVSYSWATNSYPARSFGSRCNTKDPARDENGRIIDSDCFDLNPADWHIAVVHIIGQLKRSFVMDATYDYEVWNQPVKNYKYSYFNVNTGKSTPTLAEAIVEKENIVKDPYAKYRDEKSVSIVGVRMQVAYVVESSPNTRSEDSPNNDMIRWVSYHYDLELDKEGLIIGGEWHTAAHPDFIWTPYANAKPLSSYDIKLLGTKWDDTNPLPAAWVKAAQNASPRGIILNHIAENILLKSAR